MLKKLILILFVCHNVAASAQTDNSRACLFPFSDVQLLPSRFHDNFKRDSAWMMSIPVNSLLHSFQTTSGAFAGREGGYMTVKKLGGWESMDCDLRGHTTGHLLSALATLYAQTNSTMVKAKADSIINGLNEVQKAYNRGGYLSAFGEGLIDRNIHGKSVWAPWYTLHKILQGLIDQYTLCGNDTALAVAKRMGDWAYNKLKPLSEETRWKMLRNEFGGFNDAMYQLYAITKDERYLWVAQFFYHNDKIDPLKAGNDDLGTNHANTFIPKLLGEAQWYELQGRAQGPTLQAGDSSRRACELLFNTLAFKHAFVTGEVSDKEHLFNPSQQSKHLTGYDGENCCTFNLLKLAEHVYSWNIDDNAKREKITSYYERALYNHILGQQDPQSSMVCYFTPLMSGAYRLYSTKDSSFWCCVGSGFESHVRYARFIYAHKDNDLYVNLLIPSTLNWDGTMVTQQTDFPNSGKVIYTITGKSRTFNLHLRKPSWATAVTVKVNGRKIKGDKVTIKLNAQSSTPKAIKVEVTYGMALYEETMKDNPNRFAVLYGPIVLSGSLGEVAHPFSDPKKYNDYYTFNFKVPEALNDKCRLKGIDELKYVSPLHYKTPSGVELRPFYDAHNERYVVYWNRLAGAAMMSAQYHSEVWSPDLGNGYYKNPVLNADYSDPDAIAVGDDYYLTASSFNCVPGLPILHSKDLVNWEIVNHALPSLDPDSLFSKPQHGKGVWAPAIRCHGGEYYIYWGDPDRGIFMVKTDDIRGAWSKPTCVIEGKGMIDPCPLWDDDGRCYLVNAWSASRAGLNSVLTMRELNSEGTQAIGNPSIVFDGGQTNFTSEGPKLYKKDGWYWIFCPAGGVEHGWQLAMRSKSIFGPYEWKVVMAQGKTNVNGPHQGAWVHTTMGEDWFLHFNDRGAYGRVVYLQPVTWRDGWPVIGNAPKEGYCGEPLMTCRMPKSRSVVKVSPQESDEFNSTTLGLQWQWHANYQQTFGMPMTGGWLRLYNYDEAQTSNLWSQPNLLLQKLPAEKFTATAKVCVAAKEDGQYAGIIMMGMDYGALVVNRANENFEVELHHCKDADTSVAESRTVIATVRPTTRDTIPYSPSTYLDIYLRMNVDNGKCQFAYSLDGKHFKDAGVPFTMRQGKWIGAKMGFVSACSGRKGNRGWLDADWFRVTR